MKIFFDLDGTLLDSKPRLYKLFQMLVPDSKLSFEGYWNLKKNKIGHKEILKSLFLYSDDEITLFEESWMNKIEGKEWLALDQPFVGITEYLNELMSRHELYIVTARQNESAAINQIEKFGWIKIFKKILVTSQKREKHELIRDQVIFKDGWFVGDTGKDIMTGKGLGLSTAAVLSGFLNEEKLKEYYPDIIVEQVIDLKF